MAPASEGARREGCEGSEHAPGVLAPVSGEDGISF